MDTHGRSGTEDPADQHAEENNNNGPLKPGPWGDDDGHGFPMSSGASGVDEAARPVSETTDASPYSLQPAGALPLHAGHPLGDGRFPVDVQQWRETGFGAYRFNPECLYPGNSYWRPAYGGYPVSGPSSGLSRGSSRDDLTSMEGQLFEYEERFRVDRRKLELLMMGRYDPVKEPALDFFQRVGEETRTTVIWPSRLKIGAKSKKDPHIRIGGSEDCVKRAKAIIMEYLDTKTTRVTMKMDVSYTDHSHIIGKGGNTIRRVMTETGCHIHFPDSNRSNPNEKSNQVSIAGELDGVERARARVRELAPLVFNFDLPVVPSVDVVSHDPSDPYLKAIQEQYNIQVMFRQKQKNFPTTVVVVKGCEWESARVKEATLLLVDHLCSGYANHASGMEDPNRMTGPMGQNIPISMNMEISPIHHAVVLGKGNMTLRTIMQRTKTTILFPDAGDPNIPPIRKGSVTITGSIHNVYYARQQLLGSLPLVMMFEMPDNMEILDDAGIQKLQEELDVCISIKPKQRQANKSVLIKAQERNASSIYKVRQMLLGLEGDPVEANIPETYKMPSGTSPQFGGESFLASAVHDLSMKQSNKGRFVGGFNPMMFPPPPPSLHDGYGQFNHLSSTAMGRGAGMHQFSGGGVHGSPYLTDIMRPRMPTHLSPNGTLINQDPSPSHGFGNPLPPNHPFLQDYALLVLKNITRLQQQEEQSKQIMLDRSKLEDPNNNYISGTRNKNGDGVNPRNSSPSHELGNLSNQLEELDLSQSKDCMKSSNRESYLSSSGTRQKTSCSSGSTLESSNDISSCGDVFQQMNGSNLSSQGAAQDLERIFAGCGKPQDPHDWKAPGCEKKTLEMAKGHLGDYDTKRLLASKALQTKPHAGEPRTPTTTWSGLGFSSSMPESMIRGQLDSSNSNNAAAAAAAAAVAVATEADMVTHLPNAPTCQQSFQSQGQRQMNGRIGQGVKQRPPPISQTAGHWFGNSSALDTMLNSKGTVHEPTKFEDDLPSLLANQGLGKYSDFFHRHEVDIQTFASLTEQDLKEIGIQTFGARKKLMILSNKVKQMLSEKDALVNRW